MANDFYSGIYNPDVLSCLANLSSDEVFTPPGIANQMLDLLPQELFQNPETKYLDPGCKSGIFLREIAKRLLKGLEQLMPDLEQRVDHIFHNQLYGVAITELTSLLARRGVYCSKYPNSIYSVTRFKGAEGNIRFKRTQHHWKNGLCVYCGANQQQYDRGESRETHAYEWLHTMQPEEIFNMKFDVIIGNPPYQLSDGGALASASPIYDKFVDQAKKLTPRYITMIIPARWYGGGKGLDSFREEMIKDKRIRVLHDFLNASDCFGTGVEIKGGICYFLWDRDNPGLCEIITHDEKGIKLQSPRFLQENNSDVFIRYELGVSIFQKIRKYDEPTLNSLVSSQKPFGLRTFVKGQEKPFPDSVKVYQNGGVGYIQYSEIEKNHDYINKYKVYISRAYNAGDKYPHQIIGKPILGEQGSCCTETYVLIGPFETNEAASNLITYIQTKLCRFLISLKKVSQMAPASVYSFVPLQDLSKSWTDKELYTKYGLTEEEITFIESMIKPMGRNDDDASN